MNSSLKIGDHQSSDLQSETHPFPDRADQEVGDSSSDVDPVGTESVASDGGSFLQPGGCFSSEIIRNDSTLLQARGHGTGAFGTYYPFNQSTNIHSQDHYQYHSQAHQYLMDNLMFARQQNSENSSQIKQLKGAFFDLRRLSPRYDDILEDLAKAWRDAMVIIIELLKMLGIMGDHSSFKSFYDAFNDFKQRITIILNQISYLQRKISEHNTYTDTISLGSFLPPSSNKLDRIIYMFGEVINLVEEAFRESCKQEQQAKVNNEKQNFTFTGPFLQMSSPVDQPSAHELYAQSGSTQPVPGMKSSNSVSATSTSNTLFNAPSLPIGQPRDSEVQHGMQTRSRHHPYQHTFNRNRTANDSSSSLDGMTHFSGSSSFSSDQPLATSRTVMNSQSDHAPSVTKHVRFGNSRRRKRNPPPSSNTFDSSSAQGLADSQGRPIS